MPVHHLGPRLASAGPPLCPWRGMHLLLRPRADDRATERKVRRRRAFSSGNARSFSNFGSSFRAKKKRAPLRELRLILHCVARARVRRIRSVVRRGHIGGKTSVLKKAKQEKGRNKNEGQRRTMKSRCPQFTCSLRVAVGSFLSFKIHILREQLWKSTLTEEEDKRRRRGRTPRRRAKTEKEQVSRRNKHSLSSSRFLFSKK